MTRSMTGFARCEKRDGQGEWVWEIRSVNHRFLEIMVRLPEELRTMETAVRDRVGSRLGRGKIDCTLRYLSGEAASSAIRLNLNLARAVVAATEQIAGLIGGGERPAPMQVLQWPGVVEQQREEMGPVMEAAMVLLDQALSELSANRQREGERLAALILGRCHALRQQAQLARARMPLVLSTVRERLRQRLEEVLESLDAGRLEQEMVLVAQRLDVDEELDRLSAHLDEVGAVVQRDEPIGRRLDFLMQELNREANTLTSKSSDVQMTQCAVEMKVLIEQMREQVQNIE